MQIYATMFAPPTILHTVAIADIAQLPAEAQLKDPALVSLLEMLNLFNACADVYDEYSREKCQASDKFENIQTSD